MAQLNNLIVRGSSRFLNNITVNGKIYPSGLDVSGCNIGYNSGALSLKNNNSYINIYNDNMELYTNSLSLQSKTWGVSSGTTAVVTSAGFLTKSSSSRRYKTNINYDFDVEKCHNDLMSLKPCEYSYKATPDLTEFGMIAEEVADVNKNLVIIDDKTKCVDAYKDKDITTMLVVELQEKDKVISELQSQVQELIKQVDEIKKKI